MDFLRGETLAKLNAFPLPVRFDPARTILLTGSPRSGTTWLGQTLGASKDCCLVTEPFHLKMPGLREAGFTWRSYVDPDTPWPEGKAIIESLLRGKGVSVKLLHRNPRRLFTARRLVLKAVRANRLLPWLARNVRLGGRIHLIRHPCAAVSSQMRHPLFPTSNRVHDFDLRYLELRLPKLVDFARGLTTDEEVRALTWALDQHAPLSARGSPDDWTTVSYEQLVREGRGALERLFATQGLAIEPEVERRFRQSSWQRASYSADHERASVAERLGVWKSRLTDSQIDRILAVVDACGIRGFSRNVLPDPAGIRVDATDSDQGIVA